MGDGPFGGRIALGQGLTFGPGYTYGASFPAGMLEKDVNLYLPASSAGSPAISPAFDTNFWSSTSLAVRVPGRMNAKFGTSLETFGDTVNTIHIRRLARQFVIPLSKGLNICVRKADAANPTYNRQFGLQGTLQYLVASLSSDTQIVAISNIRVVDSGGTTRNPNPTKSGVTVPSGGGTTMTGTGFSAGDVGRSFIVENHDNLLTGGPGVNSIVGFTSSTTVTISSGYDTLSDTPGASRTIRYLDDGGPAITYAAATNSTSDTALQAGSGGDHTNYCDYILDSDYLVIEIGYTPILPTPGTPPARSFHMKFGDPTDQIIVYPNTTHSCGATPFYTGMASHIGMSTP